MRAKFAEIHYYIYLKINDMDVPLTIASFYGPPDPELYQASSKTYASMHHFRDIDVRAIDIKSIESVVMMAPDNRYLPYEADRWFMMEKPGLKISSFLELHEDFE